MPRLLTVARVPYGFVHRDVPGADLALWRIGDQFAVIPSFLGDGIAMAADEVEFLSLDEDVYPEISVLAVAAGAQGGVEILLGADDFNRDDLAEIDREAVCVHVTNIGDRDRNEGIRRRRDSSENPGVASGGDGKGESPVVCDGGGVGGGESRDGNECGVGKSDFQMVEMA